MKLFILSLALAAVALWPMGAWADIIVKKDGSTLEVYNIEVGPKYITYTKEASPESDLGRVPVDECFAIKTADGEMKAIAAANTTPAPQAAPKEASAGPVRIPAHPAADNAELLNRYNSSLPHHVKPNKNKDGKPDKADLLDRIYGFLDSSILSDSIITISLEKADVSYSELANWFGHKENGCGYYKIKVTNKTDQNVYIDMMNSFRFNSDGEATPFYDSKSVTHNSNSGGGAGVNLGAVTGALGVGGALGTLASGVNVGGGSSSGTSVTETQSTVAVIPPHGSIIMPQRIIVNDKGNKVIKNYECLFHIPHVIDKEDFYNTSKYLKKIGLPHERDRYYDISEITEYQGRKGFADEIRAGKHPEMTISRVITYSTAPDFKQYTSLKFDMYTRGYFGAKGKAPVNHGKYQTAGDKYSLNDCVEFEISE